MKTKIINTQFLIFSVTLAILILFSGITQAQVVMEKSVMTIPTYKNNPPNPMPRFFQWEGHQGAQRREYPYPVDDNLTRNKTNVDYPVVKVENDYIKLAIMPEMGGRIYFAIDKTNDYTWFYHNHVVKPSLIGMLGNWVSGSMAWGFPHHHGPNTVKPMDFKIVDNEDGSKTTWVTNTDRHLRISVLVGYTVYPNSSIVEMTVHPMNNTAITNSFLFWANPSVHVDTSYQVIFPPSVNYVTFHAKRDMTTWPVADGWFNGYDFTNVDVSWWKNTHIPSSYFSWDPKEGYFGGYDHNKKAGTAWVGNRYLNPGMKFWADGNNAAGRLINAGLTDDDTQYIELMAGAFTDNQPDYSWIQPYESKTTTMIWFPIRELGGIKFANRNGALNYEITDNSPGSIRMNTTSPHKNARVLLKSMDKIVFEETISIGPAEPYVNDKINLPSGINEDNITISLVDNTGKTLMSFTPVDHLPPDIPKPEPLKAIAAPEDIESVEELYQAGLRLNQFYNPSVDPMPYYQEALKRDPGNARVNTQLGILEIKNYNWDKAAFHLTTAVERVTANYTRPRDCESLFYLGIVLRAQGKQQDAYEMLYRSTWDNAWHTAAYYQLAEIDVERGDYIAALDHLNRSLKTGADQLKAINLMAFVNRKSGDYDAAINTALKALDINLLDHQALNELYLSNLQAGNKTQASENLAELINTMRDDVQSYLELATHYMNFGSYDEAQSILSRLEGKSDFPMLYYYMAYCSSKLGDESMAMEYYKLAANKPHIYCFPFRVESVSVLEAAMSANPGDAKTPYYLGNLMFERQPERAISLWEKSRDLDGSFYIVHRNLGFAYKQVQQDNEKAMLSYEKALESNNTDPRLLFELDEIYTLNKIPVEKRYKILKDNEVIAKQYSPTLLRLTTRTVEMGKYNEAIEILEKKTIAEKEGDRELRNTFLNAYSLRTLENLEKKNYKKSLSDIETALGFPIGLEGRSRVVQLNYFAGLVHEASGEIEKSKDFYNRSLEFSLEARSREQEHIFYQGLAHQRLGNNDEARQFFNLLLANVQKQGSSTFFTQFGRGNENIRIAENHYLTGLAYLGLGEKDKSRTEFTKALEYNPDHVWSKVYLDNTKVDMLISR